jgi:hypothetical protein
MKFRTKPNPAPNQKWRINLPYYRADWLITKTEPNDYIRGKIIAIGIGSGGLGEPITELCRHFRKREYLFLGYQEKEG